MIKIRKHLSKSSKRWPKIMRRPFAGVNSVMQLSAEYPM